jgi:hypothetical protein
VLNLKDEDGLGIQYNQLNGKEMMVLDMESDEWASGEFANKATSLYQVMKNAGGGVSSDALRCAIVLSNFKKSGGTIGGKTPVGLGLKCEDDNQGSWRCDDDAVFIGWGGDGSHRYGASKCGTDGGQDIYAGGNVDTGGWITVWVR